MSLSAIVRYLPRKALSRLAGKIMHWQGPIWYRQWSIKFFVKMYHINLDEAEKNINDYLSIGDFFIRKLKPGLRPLPNNPEILHPADSVISQWGPLKQGSLIQAKGKFYSGERFVGTTELFNKIKDGFFLTYYLCPTDYHRVHSPVEGTLLSIQKLGSDLWPVNQWSTDNIEEVFNQNERVVLEIETQQGMVALVFVGATNVGSIVLNFDEKKLPLQIKFGETLGWFSMGSTVVMIYSESFQLNQKKLLGLGTAVKVNSTLLG